MTKFRSSEAVVVVVVQVAVVQVAVVQVAVVDIAASSLRDAQTIVEGGFSGPLFLFCTVLVLIYPSLSQQYAQFPFATVQ